MAGITGSSLLDAVVPFVAAATLTLTLSAGVAEALAGVVTAGRGGEVTAVDSQGTLAGSG